VVIERWLGSGCRGSQLALQLAQVAYAEWGWEEKWFCDVDVCICAANAVRPGGVQVQTGGKKSVASKQGIAARR
jgi:hypothetical protein